MAAKKIKFSDLNVQVFMSVIKNADINSGQVLDIRTDKIVARGAPSNNNYIKHTSIATDDVMTIDEMPSDAKIIRIMVSKYQPLIKIMEIFNKNGSDKLSGIISYTILDDEQGYIDADYISFEDTKGTKIKFKTSDITTSEYIKDRAWGKYSDVSEGLEVKFNFNREAIDKIDRMVNVDKLYAKDEYFNIVMDINENSVVFRSFTQPGEEKNERWSTAYDKSMGKLEISKNVNSEKYVFSNKILELLDRNEYTGHIIAKNGSYFLIFHHSEENGLVVALAVKPT